MLYCDQDKLDRILLNLLSNSIKQKQESRKQKPESRNRKAESRKRKAGRIDV